MKQISVLFFTYKDDMNSTTPREWKTWLAWTGLEPRTSIRAVDDSRYLLHL